MQGGEKKKTTENHQIYLAHVCTFICEYLFVLKKKIQKRKYFGFASNTVL